MPKIRVNEISLHYETTGEGHPLVFNNGGGLDLSSWHCQVAYFSKRYRCISYDARGHGLTDLPEEGYSQDDCVEDLRQLLDSLSIERAYLAGLSMGGYTALSFSLRYPERVAALVLAGSSSRPLYEETQKRSEEAISGILKSKGVGVAIRYRKAYEANANRPDLTGRLPELSMPVLIIVGEQDTSEPPHISREMHRRISNSQLEVIPNCGHRCNEEQPETFNKTVERFLKVVGGG